MLVVLILLCSCCRLDSGVLWLFLAVPGVNSGLLLRHSLAWPYILLFLCGQLLENHGRVHRGEGRQGV